MNILLILMILTMLYLVYDLSVEIVRCKILTKLFQIPFLYWLYKTSLRLDVIAIMIEIDDYMGACLAPSFIKETIEDPSILKSIKRSDNTLEFSIMLPYIVYTAILTFYKNHDIVAYYKEHDFIKSMSMYGEEQALEEWNLYDFLFEFLKNDHHKEYKVVRDFVSLNEERLKENKKENQVFCKTVNRLLYTGHNYIDDINYQNFYAGRNDRK